MQADRRSAQARRQQKPQIGDSGLEGLSAGRRVETIEVPINDVVVPQQRIRPLDPRHVLDLAESIAVLGLMQPPVVDRRNVLIAGGHRLAALRLLAAPTIEDAMATWRAIADGATARAPRGSDSRIAALDRSRFSTGLIQVARLDATIEEDPQHAVALEVAENEKRRNYSAAEAREIAQRLRDAGFRDANGRPSKGERALRPALALILGKSTRAVRRILCDSETRTDVRVPGKRATAPRAAKGRVNLLRRVIEQFLSESDESTNSALTRSLEETLRLLDIR